jgi:hypothetical protein
LPYERAGEAKFFKNLGGYLRAFFVLFFYGASADVMKNYRGES